MNLVKRGEKVLSPVLSHFTEIEIKYGRGPYLYDYKGNAYLDFASGIAVTNTGHCHPKVVKAIKNQVQKLIHACSGIVYYEPNIALAEKLKKITPKGLEHTFFTQSGTEAIEGALKLSRYVTGKKEFIAFKGCFHGRTFGSLSITTSKKKYWEKYKPLLQKINFFPYPYCYRCPFNSNWSNCTKLKKKYPCIISLENFFKKINPSKVAAAIIEPIIGEGGYIPAPLKFMESLRSLTKKHNIILIADEIQTGFGRTGKMFALEHSKINPDIICMAKGIASGLPLGAFISRKELTKKWPAGAHGSTYTGNPIGCSAGLATIKVIEDEKLPQKATKLGKFITNELFKLKQKYNFIGDIRGIGLMIGIEIVDSKNKPNPALAKKILKLALDNKLILISCGQDHQVIRIIPPLNIKMKDLKKGLNILKKVFRKI